MECINLEYRRRLPPELLTEMHKCLPLDNAIYVLVNVSNTFVINNSTRMHRTIQRIKTSLKEHIDTLVEAEVKNNPEKLVIRNEIEWKPEMDALLHFGSWLTSTRKLFSQPIIGGVPENFVQKLLLNLANSSFTQMMLQIAVIYFGTQIPTPTFLKPLFNEKQFRVGIRILFESVELKTEDGQTICIYDGELHRYGNKLRLFVMNKMNGNEWFKITIHLDSSKEFIRRLKFSRWKMQSLEDVKKFIQKDDNSFEEKDGGNTLEAKKSIFSNPNLDLFLSRGAKFTQFRHFKIKNQYPYTGLDYYLCLCPDDYVDFLIDFISNAKHPEDFLESIEMNISSLRFRPSISLFIKNIWKVCYKGIKKGGKFVNFDEKKLHILSGKTTKLTLNNKKLEFTLANLPTNGAYLFDVSVKIGNGFEHIFGIKIQKRKVDNNIVFKCEDQIEKELGKKRKVAENDDEEDEPTCSSKITKK